MPSPLSGQRIGLLSSWLSPRNGGVFEAVLAQAAIVRELGAEPVLLGLRDDRFDEALLAGHEYHVADVIGPEAVGFAPSLSKLFDKAGLDVLHLNGIWHYPTIAANHWAARTRRPLIVSPHGMLADWIVHRNRWKKAVWERAFERPMWRRARMFHALTDNEANEIGRSTGQGPIRVIPNPAPKPEPGPRSFPPPHFLYLGRIHPKKNLATLVTAWENALTRETDCKLTIAGWGDPSDVAELREWIDASPARTLINFVGPVYGEAKNALLEQARYLVLPSFSEGLPMAVLEAWSAGTPVLMSPECGLPVGYERGAAIDCGTTPSTVAAALRAGISMEASQWQAQSRAALSLADNEFGHKTVAEQWGNLYGSVLCETPNRA